MSEARLHRPHQDGGKRHRRRYTHAAKPPASSRPFGSDEARTRTTAFVWAALCVTSGLPCLAPWRECAGRLWRQEHLPGARGSARQGPHAVALPSSYCTLPRAGVAQGGCPGLCGMGSWHGVGDWHGRHLHGVRLDAPQVTWLHRSAPATTQGEAGLTESGQHVTHLRVPSGV